VNNREYWLALSCIEGLSPSLLISLIRHFRTVEALCRAHRSEILQLQGFSDELAGRVQDATSSPLHLSILKALEKHQLSYLTYDDALYPSFLRHTHDPPAVIYYEGHLYKEDMNSIAIVGARKATAYGKSVARRLACDLARSGITVISGMARGIDSWAHRGALDGGGRTIAVLGCGIDQTYPPENRGLRKDIVSNGAVISEYPPGILPQKYYFPARNRIIAGMTLGTVVVEAGLKSGSLITADFAMQSGRDVFAVPGSIMSDENRGGHALLKDGAKLVEGVDDILEELGFAVTRERKKEELPDLSDTGRKILACLGREAKTAPAIIELSGIEPQVVMAELTMLEIKGCIIRGPGNCFVRK
jgi:DNA processing protein